MGWQVLVRGPDLRPVGQVDEYVTLQVIPRYRAVGAWTLTIADQPAATALLRAAGNGVRFFLDGRHVLSGPVRGMTQARGSDDGAGGVWTFTGPCDNTWVMDGVLAWPVPSSAVTAQTDAYYKIASAAAETVLRQLVDVNAGPSAQASRQVPHLVLAVDQARGAAVSSQTRFDKLADALTAAATAGGVGFMVEQQGTDLVFVVYEPRDLSTVAKFSFGLGNLTDYSYDLAAPTVTDVVVGAGGEGAARKFALYSRPDANWPGVRVEQFADRRDLDAADTATPQAMADEAATILDEGAGSASLSVSPVDTDALAYGRDYGLGDTITVEDVTDVVREVTLTSSAQDGDKTVPTVGGDGASNAPGLYKRLAKVARSVRQLQTRQ